MNAITGVAIGNFPVWNLRKGAFLTPQECKSLPVGQKTVCRSNELLLAT
jgi:hypothetical protein